MYFWFYIYLIEIILYWSIDFIDHDTFPGKKATGISQGKSHRNGWFKYLIWLILLCLIYWRKRDFISYRMIDLHVMPHNIVLSICTSYVLSVYNWFKKNILLLLLFMELKNFFPIQNCDFLWLFKGDAL